MARLGETVTAINSTRAINMVPGEIGTDDNEAGLRDREAMPVATNSAGHLRATLPLIFTHRRGRMSRRCVASRTRRRGRGFLDRPGRLVRRLS